MSLMKTPENMSIEIDIKFMRLALREAKKGIGRTSPNPCVGAVIVQDDIVISRGYHKKAGTPHAEIHALQKAGDKARGATIYVTLEPCNHTGRTPPCSHALYKAGIRRVVVGMEDPNPLVDGSGNSFLRKKGIEVLSGVLERDCQELNLPFIKHITTGRPFVVMKAGMSLDGKLNYQSGEAGKITGEESLKKLHGLRNSFDAILVGRKTVIADNPSLTTRLVKNGRDPLRVILDSSLQISPESKIFHLKSSAPTIVFCSHFAAKDNIKQLLEIDGVLVQTIGTDKEGRLDLNDVLDNLGKMGICSLLVEGGAAVHSSFLKKDLVDRVMLFMAPLFGGSEGTPLLSNLPVNNRKSAPKLLNVSYRRYGDDILIQGDLTELICSSE